MDSEGKVNMEVLKYDLDELFDNPPIFAEPVMRFQDVLLNPDEDRELILIDKKSLRSAVTDYTRAMARFKKDV
jgi:hypothetical protein